MSRSKTKEVILALLLSCSPALANPTVGKVNDRAYITALVRTDRAKRSAATFYLVPGKIIRWHYNWVLEDGNQADQVLDKPLAGVPDERPFSQKHPNIYTAAVCVGALSGPATGTMAGMVLSK